MRARGRSGAVTRCIHGERKESGAEGKERGRTGQDSSGRDTGRSDTALSEHLEVVESLF